MGIKVLEKQVAELIAAGEVIERPASIVKELMENSLDAGASAVTVEIRNGGISYIRVTDNGCGISHEDAPRAFLRHATSKISTKEDLDSISTLGFRGEALASVCAVSKTELVTKRREDSFGTRVYIEGGEQKAFSETGAPDGTTVTVKDLFYNTPARLKFLKKDSFEAATIAQIVGQIALSHPEVSVNLIKDGKSVLHTPGNGELISAIYAVHGAEFASHLIKAEYSYKGIEVSGYICDPMYGRKNRSYQHFFVNGRYVKTSTVAYALQEGYKNSIMVGKFPACALFINLDPSLVDANVHPAKIEIRFTSDREVYDAVYFAVKTALDFKGTAADKAESIKKQAAIRAVSENAFHPASAQQIRITPTPTEVKNNSAQIKSRIILEEDSPKAIEKVEKNTDFSSVPVSFGSRLADSTKPSYCAKPSEDEGFMFIKPEQYKAEPARIISEEPKEIVKAEKPQEEEQPEVSVIGEIFSTYILASRGNEFIIIDKHAAHERIIFEKLKSSAKSSSQLLLSPVAVNLSPTAHTALMGNMEAVAEMGFEIEDFGGSSVMVRAVPDILVSCDIPGIIEEIADNLLSFKKSLSPAEVDELYHSVACKAAIKANDKNNTLELAEIVKRVAVDGDIRYCPHGRPVFMSMTKNELDGKFGRLGK